MRFFNAFPTFVQVHSHDEVLIILVDLLSLLSSFHPSSPSFKDKGNYPHATVSM